MVENKEDKLKPQLPNELSLKTMGDLITPDPRETARNLTAFAWANRNFSSLTALPLQQLRRLHGIDAQVHAAVMPKGELKAQLSDITGMIRDASLPVATDERVTAILPSWNFRSKANRSADIKKILTLPIDVKADTIFSISRSTHFNKMDEGEQSALIGEAMKILRQKPGDYEQDFAASALAQLDTRGLLRGKHKGAMWDLVKDDPELYSALQTSRGRVETSHASSPEAKVLQGTFDDRMDTLDARLGKTREPQSFTEHEKLDELKAISEAVASEYEAIAATRMFPIARGPKHNRSNSLAVPVASDGKATQHIKRFDVRAADRANTSLGM